MMDPSADALSDVLRMVHLKACIYFVKDMAAPWGMDIPRAANGPLHMVLAGGCTLRCRGLDVRLKAGDAVLLPHGASHQMLDDPTTKPEPGPEVMQRLLNGGGDDPGESATRMLCGHFEWDGAFEHPFFNELPELITIRGIFDQPDGDRSRSIVDLIAAESGDERPGGSAIADRMGEVLFVSLLRSWMMEKKPDKGILATINDPRLSRALRHIHQNPDGALELSDLARVAGMSRTSFAMKFRDVMGAPPAAYLAEWRMLTARRLLIQTDLSLSDIVERVGYGSDAAFIRAFKRRFGETPGKLRRKPPDVAAGSA